VHDRYQNNVPSSPTFDQFSLQVSLFSLEEKVSVATGVGWMNGRCVVNLEYSWKSKCD